MLVARQRIPIGLLLATREQAEKILASRDGHAEGVADLQSLGASPEVIPARLPAGS
jgi:hypothetical protein